MEIIISGIVVMIALIGIILCYDPFMEIMSGERVNEKDPNDLSGTLSLMGMSSSVTAMTMAILFILPEFI